MKARLVVGIVAVAVLLVVCVVAMTALDGAMTSVDCTRIRDKMRDTPAYVTQEELVYWNTTCAAAGFTY